MQNIESGAKQAGEQQVNQETHERQEARHQATPLSSFPGMGDRAPAPLVTQTPGGEVIPLSTLWADGPALLVFLRHLGCMFCREQVALLREVQPEFERLGARVALITIGSPNDTASFCAGRAPDITFVCVSDHARHAYRAYGLSRTNTRDLLLSPHIYARGFQAALHGHFAGMPKGDILQMPGVFIVDAQGIIQYAHRHKDAADNPPTSALLAELERIVHPAHSIEPIKPIEPIE